VIIWVDAQLSPAIAEFIEKELGVHAASARRLEMTSAEDADIFAAAKQANAVVLTKDADFPLQLQRHGPPPKVLWLRCGNTSNAHLRDVLRQVLPTALKMLEAGEILVEITEPNSPKPAA
jgi:predicted nuclease of predicted toxin-antitoxin system